MRYSRCHLLGTLLPLVPFSTAAPAESVRFPRHATVVDHRAVANNYTFIIAGGGIAGLTLADRLTEDPNGEPDLTPDLTSRVRRPACHLPRN
jgi:hypothetical protein